MNIFDEIDDSLERYKNTPNHATISKQVIKCGRPNCTKCPHGDYWFAYWRENGKVKSKYIGKHNPELIPIGR